jgi:23S rRNA (cytosine1962-C5)-methyltransferase
MDNTTKIERVQVRRNRKGHPWIFSNELQSVNKDIPAGSIVDIYKGRKYCGRGFYNPHSLIALRKYSEYREDFDAHLVERYIQKADVYRQHVLANSSYRMVFSESDNLPGLIIDKYEQNFVMQVNCYGVDQRKDLVVDVLKRMFPGFIYEKSDEYYRKMEGLDIDNRVLYGTCPEVVEIVQNGIRFLVDVRQGQKTGFFFDLTEIRNIVLAIARQKRVLDLCCYTGGFSLYAAAGYADAVKGIDQSAAAIELARENARLNGIKCATFECCDVFDYLRNDKDLFDIIILDPPSFIKSKKKLADARRGYKEMNLRAMRKLERNGMLITTCCSYHVSENDFLEILRKAAIDAGVRFRILGRGGQSPDHPVLLTMPETNYLKSFYLQVT